MQSSTILSRPSLGASGPSGVGRTAPVLEYICLFTHDLRKKHKRWEDGRLKYHTFNKRVMVYDERGHFVGDMHWHHDWDFDEGEEVQLDRGGVIVQVVECVGRQEQDLTELLDKRAKEKEQRQARAATRPALPAASAQTPVAGSRVQDHFQTRHRPLHQLLGTPTGHHGRAVVPNESPFELRTKANETPEGGTSESRPAKRRKYDISPPSKKGYAQNLFGATLSLSAVPQSSAPRRPTPTAYQRHRESSPPEEDLPAEEALPDQDQVRAGPVRHGDTRPSVVESRANRVAPLPRTYGSPDRARMSGSPEAAESIPDAWTRTRPGTTAAASRLRKQPQTDRNDDEQGSSRIDIPIQAVAKGALVSRGRQRQAQARVANEAVIDKTFNVGNKPDIGTTLSQAIVVDEVADRESVGAGRSAKTLDADSRQKPAKRKTKPVLEARPSAAAPRITEARRDIAEPAVQNPPEEERTELRLKPRQKRGLLLLSEKRKKPKQPKRQATPTRDEIFSEERPRSPSNAVALELDVQALPDAVEHTYEARQENPFLSSPPAFERHTVPEGRESDSELPLPRSRGNQQSRQVKSIRETTLSVAPGVSARGHDESGVTIKDTDEEEDADVRPPPKRSRLRTKRDVSGDAREVSRDARDESPDAAVLDTGETPTAPVQAVEEPKPGRRTRKSRASNDQIVSRARKEAQRAESEESGKEELPRAPAAPRIARLSRKSVRSREVFGFVPSNTTVPIAANPLQQTLDASSIISAHADDTAGATPLPAAPSHDTTVPNGRQPLVEKSRNRLPPTTSLRDPPAALQRHNSVPEGKTGKAAMGPQGEGVEEAADMQPSNGQSTRRGLTRHTSVVLPTGSGRDEPMATASISVAVPKGTVLPQEETRATARPRRADEASQPAAPDTTLHSPLHNAPDVPDSLAPQTGEAREIGVEPGVTEHASHPPPAAAQPAEPPRPRIANPATRGRKAALKSDAAGQVPQSILPPVDTLLVPVRAAGVLPSLPPPPPRAGGISGPEPAAAAAAAANDRPKRTMRFPGFVSAKQGGPWSREAHDLLESGRPG